jgi:hypothetical protein
VVGTRTGRLLRGLPVLLALTGAVAPAPAARPTAWTDLPAAVHARLEAAGVSSSAFPGFLDRLNQAHAQRVREGDLDHLVFYLLQSTHFTRRPPIEPALSAKALVDALPAAERDAFLRGAPASPSRASPDVRARVAALVRAMDSPDADARVAYFRALVTATVPARRDRDAAIVREYLRAMRFLYEKEFVAQRSARAAEAVAELYQARGLSTDTAVEAGYLVYLGLGVVKALEPDRRVRRVLIVGPGLDLAPRTGLLDASPPESYQPWTAIDALLALGLAGADDLEVTAADINPRVVDHLRGSADHAPMLRLVSGIQETDGVTFSREYRDYFAGLGRAAGAIDTAAAPESGRMAKAMRVDRRAARTLRAETLDVVTERLDAAPFDIVIATNILPYFDDTELALAMSNIAGMLAPGGVLLHNDARPAMADVTAAAGLRFEQARQAIIATVRGAPPLGDSIWLHRKARSG